MSADFGDKIRAMVEFGRVTDPDSKNVDPSAEAWAARAFAALATIGNLSQDPVVEDSIVSVLGKAPLNVLVGGTLALTHARAQAARDND